MKNFLYLPLIILGVLLKFCTSNKEITTQTSNTGVVGTEFVKTDRTVSPLLHGFNTENLYFHYQGEEDAKQLMKELGPKVLRFPGGTPANIYHFERAGYGYDSMEAEQIEKNTGPSRNALKCVRLDSQHNKAKEQRENYAKDFARLLKELDASVLLVANLISSEEDVMEMVDFFMDESVRVAGIELGNEFYLSDYRGIFPSVDDYISKAKSLAVRIRSAYPEIPLAVNAAPNDLMKKLGMRQQVLSNSWNEALNKEDFYDAVIVHMYSKKRECDELNESARFDCYQEHNIEYISESVGSSLLAMSSAYSGRPIWITEWNLKDVFKGLGDTFLQSIYYADYAMEISRTKEVQVATYHNLLNGGNGHNLIGKNKSKVTGMDATHVPRAVYPVAELLSSIYDGQHLVLNTPDLGLDSELIGLSAFESTNELILIMTNRGNAELNLRGLQLMDLLPSYTILSRSVVGNSLQNATYTIKEQEAENLETALKISIPPLSITKLSINKN